MRSRLWTRPTPFGGARTSSSCSIRNTRPTDAFRRTGVHPRARTITTRCAWSSTRTRSSTIKAGSWRACRRQLSISSMWPYRDRAATSILPRTSTWIATSPSKLVLSLPGKPEGPEWLLKWDAEQAADWTPDANAPGVLLCAMLGESYSRRARTQWRTSASANAAMRSPALTSRRAATGRLWAYNPRV